jgi:hypothetical protein
LIKILKLKNLIDGSLDVIEQTYSIKHNDNKRDLIYNENNILVETKPKVLSVAVGLSNKTINPFICARCAVPQAPQSNEYAENGQF